MTVKELIKALLEFDQDASVYAMNDEWGVWVKLEKVESIQPDDPREVKSPGLS